MNNRIKKYNEFETQDYFTNGKYCLEAANHLYKFDKVKRFYPVGLLIVHALELLLKAFINHFDSHQFTNVQKLHDLQKLHGKAVDIDVSKNVGIFSHELNSNILRFIRDFYGDSVAVRYKITDCILDFKIIISIKEKMVNPMENLLRNHHLTNSSRG